MQAVVVLMMAVGCTTSQPGTPIASDASSDAGIVDAGMVDAMMPVLDSTVSDADMQDADECVASSCADTIPCTLDACGDGGCVNTPDDSLCADREMCDPTYGCLSECSTAPSCSFRLPQCGCPDELSCYYHPEGPRCMATGANTLGSECAEHGSCEPGHLCLPANAGATQSCFGICDSSEECPDGTGCYRNYVRDGMDTGVTVCTQACDPIAQTGCMTGSACLILAGEGVGSFTDCGVIGSGEVDDPCSSSFDCAPGLTCGGSRCLRICDAKNRTSCPSGEICAPMFDRIVRGGTVLGYCLPTT